MRNGVIGWFKKREIEEDKKIETVAYQKMNDTSFFNKATRLLLQRWNL